MASDEKSIQRNVRRAKRLKEGLNVFNGRPFVYEICEEDEEINREQPAEGFMTPIYSPVVYGPMAGCEEVREMYAVRIWEGVPDEYKPILVIHELREFDTNSHELAKKYEMKFARRLLGDKKFHEYVKWRKNYDKYEGSHSKEKIYANRKVY